MFATPRDYLDVVGRFGVIRGVNVDVPPANWTLENATYDVTDTCSDPVAAPAVLAATGTDAAPSGLAGVGILALGALSVTISRRLRRSIR